MEEFQSRVSVHCVSAPPGTGKTRAAIRHMVNHVKRGLEGHPVGYMFYVTPTLNLMKQTLRNLRAQLTVDECQMVRSVASKKNKSTTPVRVRKILDGVHNSKNGSGRRFGPGSILFMTHPTFLKLNTHRKLKDTTVIFDESRKWVMDPKPLSQTGTANKLFTLLFNTKPLEIGGKTYNNIMMLSARKLTVEERKRRDRLRSRGSKSTQCAALLELHRQIYDARQSRVEVYAMTQGSSLVQLQLPRRPFEGYRKVYVLSADFTTSQMYHLMKYDGCHMPDATVDFIGKHYTKYLSAVQKRYDKLILIPLLDDVDKPISSGVYEKGLILPRKNLKAFDDYVINDLKLNASTVREYIERFKEESESDLSREDIPQGFLTALKTYGALHDTTSWKLSRAAEVARRWTAKHPYETKPILFMNNDTHDGSLTRDIFKSVSTGKAEGNNTFLKCNVVAFLAAINPKPQVVTLLNALLQHQAYDVNEDYVVDKAIQCIGRGNIRDQNSDDYMVAIVSNRYMAERIRKRLSERPQIRDARTAEFGNYCVWDRTTINKERTPEERAAARRQSLAKLRSNPWQRPYDRAKARRKYQLKIGNSDVADLDREIAELKIKRDNYHD